MNSFNQNRMYSNNLKLQLTFYCIAFWLNDIFNYGHYTARNIIIHFLHEKMVASDVLFSTAYSQF